MSLYYFYRARQGFGAMPAIIAGVLVLTVANTQPLKLEPHYDERAVEIALVAPEPSPAPEPDPAPMPEPAPPAPADPTSAEQPPVVEAPEAPLPPPPKPVAKPVPKPAAKPAPRPAPKPVVNPAPAQQPTPPVPQPAPPAAPKPPAAPAAPKVDTQALEGGYMTGLRNDIDRYKQYPTGRQASLERPAGEVVVWLLVDRAGNVLDAGVQTPAASQLLNRAASNSLRRIKQVKPFPEQAFGGRSEQRFTATFNYSAP